MQKCLVLFDKRTTHNEKFDTNIKESRRKAHFARCEVLLSDVGIVPGSLNKRAGFSFASMNRAYGWHGHTTTETCVERLWTLYGKHCARYAPHGGSSPLCPVALKENYQPLKLLAVAVFFLLLKVFSPKST